MSIDLRNAKPGDKLITKHGNTMVYIGYYPGTRYPHAVLYSNGSEGTRLDVVYCNWDKTISVERVGD